MTWRCRLHQPDRQDTSAYDARLAIVAIARENSSKENISLIRDSIAAVPVLGAIGGDFPLSTTLSAEDEVLVIAAERGDIKRSKNRPLRKKAVQSSRTVSIGVLNTHAFPLQRFPESKAITACVRRHSPPDNEAAAKTDCVLILESEASRGCQPRDDEHAVAAG